jgi:hypothetical protein
MPVDWEWHTQAAFSKVADKQRRVAIMKGLPGWEDRKMYKALPWRPGIKTILSLEGHHLYGTSLHTWGTLDFAYIRLTSDVYLDEGILKELLGGGALVWLQAQQPSNQVLGRL